MSQKIERLYRHRDLNWLSFNARVLQEAEDAELNPIYGRLKFLAIFSSNLDEYFRVRVSQLRQIKKIDKSLRKRLSLRPKKIVKEILNIVQEQQERFGDIFYNQIVPELADNGIRLLDLENFGESQIKSAKSIFESLIKQHLETEILEWDNKQPIFLENQGLYFLVQFEEGASAGIVNIPDKQTGRFINLDSNGAVHDITFVDDIVRLQAHTLFPAHKIKGIYSIKLSRDAELYMDDEFEGVLAEQIYASLKQRTDGQPTRLLYDNGMPKELRKKLRKYLGLGKIDMVPGGEYHNFNDFFGFPDPTDNPQLHYKELPLIKHEVLENSTDYFSSIKSGDILVHFPYMSFNYVERFIEAAAEDENVRAIKISLYRVAEDSPLTTALLKAIDKGKKVTIFIEAKARFDEENNIKWGRKFEKKGGRVIYSYPKIKVHSKILFIQRKEGDKLRNYAYIGTGNFNAETSKIYCDYGLFTAHKKLTKELARVFEVLEGDLIIPRTKRLLISPFNTRQKFEDLIRREIDHTRAGRGGLILAKMNQLEDEKMINLLSRASQAGVKIKLIVRGFTCLVPGVEGLSENIEIISIVDRFLEHGRLYYFENNGEPEMYMGSADWMTRNLNRRIEVLAPVYDEGIFDELKDILDIQFSDNVKARIQNVEENNDFVPLGEGEEKIRAQYAIYEYLKEKHTT